MPVGQLVLLAGIATLVAVGVALADLSRSRDTLGGLIGQAGSVRHEILSYEEIDSPPTANGGAHDGRYFYPLARAFPRISNAAPYLDRPAYRSQRIFFPALARILHPWGDGSGLIWTMFAIGALGVFLSGFATGAISWLLGGKTWPAALIPLSYGSWVSLRITVPDPLAYGLAFSAIACSLSNRHRWAIAAGVCAVLTRESSWLLILGFAIWRRDRRALTFAGLPALAVVLWAGAVRLMQLPAPSQGNEVVEFTAPLVGLYNSAKFWSLGYEPLGFISLIPVLALGVVAVTRRGLRHPLVWPLALELALISVLNVDVLGPERNGSRMAIPVLALAAVALLTPHARRYVDRPGPPGPFWNHFRAVPPDPGPTTPVGV